MAGSVNMDSNQPVIAELERSMEALEALRAKCAEGILKGAILEEAISNLKGHLLKTVPATSPAFAFIERQSVQIDTVWSGMDGYVGPGNCGPIDHWLRAVRQALSTLDPEYIAKQGALKDSYHFSPGEPFLALSRVLQVMRRVESGLTYADPFMDEAVLNLVDLLPQQVNVLLMTTHPKPGFGLLYRALQTSST